MIKVVSTFVMAALVGVAVSAQADERRHPSGYTNADINGGYGCNVSGTLAGAGIGGAIGHGKGAAVGALAGAGSSYLYTKKSRHYRRHY